MDIKELDKKQLILLTLLITFVVSIATGIVTVSLMNQMPKSVPQTINNVIQRTIEKVTTIEVPVPQTENKNNKDDNKNEGVLFSSDNEILVSIYLNKKEVTPIAEEPTEEEPTEEVIVNNSEIIGQGVLISDVGLILVDSNLINNIDEYKVVLNKIDFNVEVLKKFNNGFTILKILPIIIDKPTEDPQTPPEIE